LCADGSKACIMEFTIEKMKVDDWTAVRDIYREGIEAGSATFETEVPSWEEWDGTHLRDCRLVAKTNGEVVGWAAISPTSCRCVYRGVGEVSLYVKASARRHGIGKALLNAVIEESERIGIWTLQGCAFPENIASIAVQKACGFREVGTREKIGCMNGQWRDVILMERRTKRIGSCSEQ